MTSSVINDLISSSYITLSLVVFSDDFASILRAIKRANGDSNRTRKHEFFWQFNARNLRKTYLGDNVLASVTPTITA